MYAWVQILSAFCQSQFLQTKRKRWNRNSSKESKIQWTYTFIVTGNHVSKRYLNYQIIKLHQFKQKQKTIWTISHKETWNYNYNIYFEQHIRTWWQTQYVGSFGSMGWSTSIGVTYSFLWLPGGGINSKSLSRSRSQSLSL